MFRLSRLTLIVDSAKRLLPFQDAAAGSKAKRRALLLIPAFAGLFSAALAGQGSPAVSKAHTASLMAAAFQDPLSLFAERSPGGRGAGALLSTKPERAAANIAPHERMLSPVQGPSLDLPGEEDPGFAMPADYLPAGDAGSNPLVVDHVSGLPPLAELYLASIPGEPDLIALGRVPPGDSIGGVPEPATWAMMILGFFATGAAMRRHMRNQANRMSAQKPQA